MSDQKDTHPEREFHPELQNIQLTYGPPLGPQASSPGFMTSGFPMSAFMNQPAQPPEGQWICSNCNCSSTGKFCSHCGQPKEMPPEGVWVCRCGFRNTGKFCENCGSPAPVPETPVWVCACGRRNTGKYCPDCGRERPSS